MSFAPPQKTVNRTSPARDPIAVVATFALLILPAAKVSAGEAGSLPAKPYIPEAATADGLSAGCRDRVEGGLWHAGKRCIDRGYLIVDVSYVPPPYVVREWEQRLVVNGMELDKDRLTDSRSRSLTEILTRDGVVIQFHDGVIATYFDAYVLDALLADKAHSTKVALLEHQYPTGTTGSDWSVLVDAFQPSVDLRQRVGVFMRRCEERHAAVPVVQLARHRLKLYTLTVIGMSLTVFAFGLVLSYRPQFTRWSDVDRSSEGVRLVFGCAGLIVLLSLFDLACTLCAQNSAGFWEINPLGAAFTSQPGLLILLKLAATTVSVSIILGLRFYRGSQVACWWVSIGLALLTARWVMFNSLLMG